MDKERQGSDFMKILHLASQFFPDYLGASVRLYYLLKNLPFEVDIIVNNKTIDGKRILLGREKFSNLIVHRMTIEPLGVFKKYPFCYLFHLIAKSNIKKLISQHQEINVIHAHNAQIITGVAAMEASRRFKIPFLCEIHGVITEYSSGAWKYIHKSYINHKSRQILNSSSQIITLTHSLKDWLQRYYKLNRERITVVPNGVDARIFSPRPEYKDEAQKIRMKLRINANNVIMYAGYMDQINGISDLIKCFPEMIGIRKDICFLFIGQGPEAEKIRDLSQEYPKSIRYIPYISHEEMPIYYQLCDVFIVPRPSTISSETLTPLKLLEVMAMEKTVLASNVGGISEVIKHRYNGYLFKKGSMESFRQILLNILDENCVQIGKKARESIIKEYTWKKSTDILQKIYRKFL